MIHLSDPKQHQLFLQSELIVYDKQENIHGICVQFFYGSVPVVILFCHKLDIIAIYDSKK